MGIDLEKFNFEMTTKEKHNLRKAIGLKDDDFVMIFPARLDKNKNQKLLIYIINKIHNTNKNIHLLLPGNDDFNGYYQKLVKKLKIQGVVHFLGQRDDIPNLLQISDIAVSSSLREGLPVHIMEAFAAGLPAIALKCRGMNDLIENGINGYIVENESEFISKIISLVEDKKKYIFMRNNNLAKIEEFSNKIINKKFKSIIKSK